MIYLYDRAVLNLLRKYFGNSVMVDEDETGHITKRTDSDYRNIDPPYITVKRETCEFSMTSSNEGGLNPKALVTSRAGILLNSTRKYNKKDNLLAIENGLIKENEGYNYYVQPVPINLKYRIEVLADNIENLDNTFADVLYVLMTDNKLELDHILSKKFTDENFYTFIDLEDSTFTNPRDKETGLRYSYEIRINITGAKLYYTKKDKVVLKVPVDYQVEKINNEEEI